MILPDTKSMGMKTDFKTGIPHSPCPAHSKARRLQRHALHFFSSRLLNVLLILPPQCSVFSGAFCPACRRDQNRNLIWGVCFEVPFDTQSPNHHVAKTPREISYFFSLHFHCPCTLTVCNCCLEDSICFKNMQFSVANILKKILKKIFFFLTFDL